MKRKDLYNILSFITNYYGGDCRFDEYKDHKLKGKFNCYSPCIILKNNGNHIDIYFDGSFHYYLDFRNEHYTIRVSKDGNIKHNIPWKRKELLNQIIKYIEDELYKQIDQYNQRKTEIDEGRIRKMNRDPRIDEYKNIAKEILLKLGYTYRTDNLLDDNEAVTETCEYRGYGLDIKACGLPGYVYEDENGGLRSFIGNYIDEIIISYNDKKVFDSSSGIYKKGIWEDILKELYNKLYVLVAKKNENLKMQKHCLEIMDSIVLPLYYKKVSKVNDTININYYSKQSSRVNNCGSYETDNHYEVVQNGKTVFHVVETSYKSYSIYSYTPGDWEKELKDYLIELELKRQEKDNNDGLEYIRQLRNLK